MWRITATLLLAFVFSANPKAQIVIDDFEVGDFSMNANEFGNFFTSRTVSVPAPHSLIGVRKIGITDEAQVSPYSAAALTSGNGYLDYSRAQDGYFILSYNGGPHMDLSSADAFNLTFSASGPLEVLVQVTDSGLRGGHAYAKSGNVTGSTTYNLPILFGDIQAGVSSMNWSDIIDITISIESASFPFNENGNYRLYDLSALAIPETTHYVVFTGLLLVGFAAYRATSYSSTKTS